MIKDIDYFHRAIALVQLSAIKENNTVPALKSLGPIAGPHNIVLSQFLSIFHFHPFMP